MNTDFKKKYEELGLNIAYFRKKKKLTQAQLAELIDVDRTHISAVELGNHAPSIDFIFSLCQELDITEKELFDFRG